MKKISSIVLSIMMIISALLVPNSVFASAYNTSQTAEALTLGRASSYVATYGYKNNNFETYTEKWYKFTAPSTDYYEFVITGYESEKYEQGSSPYVSFSVKDNKGNYVASESTDEITGLTKEAALLTRGQTYYVNVYDSGIYKNSEYTSIKDKYGSAHGYAQENISVLVKKHVHSMYISYQGTYSTYYDCEFCDYNYSKENVCKHAHTKATLVQSATYWRNGLSNTVCTDCGKTLKTYVSTTKLKAPIKKVEAGKKKATVTWNWMSGATKYQIQYSTKKNFKGAKTVKVSSSSTKKVVKKLKKGKTYYFRLRGVNGKNKSSWSKVKKVKIK